MKRKTARAFLMVGGAAALATALFAWSPLGKLLELRAYDHVTTAHHPPPMPTSVVMVLIDDKSREQIPEALVLWHKHFAQIIRTARQAGAKAVALDVIFALREDAVPPDSYRELTQAVLEASTAGTPVVLGVDNTRPAPESRLYSVAAATGSLAFLNLTADMDETVRRAVLCQPQVFSLGVAAASAGTQRPTACDAGLTFGVSRYPADASGKTLIAFRGRPYTVPSASFVDVLQLAKSGDQAHLQALFKDKLVFIGTDDVQDRHATPWGRGSSRHPGVEIHASIAQMLLDGRIVARASPTVEWLITIAALGLAVWVGVRYGWKATLVAVVVLLAALGAASALAWSKLLWLNPITPIAAVVFAYGGATLYRYQFEDRARRELRRHFSQYVPDSVIEQILAQGTGGRRQHVAVLFSDIRGFTTLTEQSVPERLVAQLNEYLEAMTEVIQEHHGMVDKFIGDGILAVFGSPIAREDCAGEAVNAATRMLERLAILNARWEREGRPKFAIGIGIHYGEAIVGDVGSERKKEYTVIGDTVNTASRVESQTKESIEKHRVHILISGATHDELKQRGHEVDAELMAESMLKGKQESTRLYLLRGLSKKGNAVGAATRST